MGNPVEPDPDGEVRVAVKQVPGGAFSSYVASTVKVGDELEVMGPEGRFTPAVDPRPRRHVLALAAGSGITPVLGIVRHLLGTEPKWSTDTPFPIPGLERIFAPYIQVQDVEDGELKVLDEQFLNPLDPTDTAPAV